MHCSCVGVVPISAACAVGIPAQRKRLNAVVVSDAAPRAQPPDACSPEIELAYVTALEAEHNPYHQDLIDNDDARSA